VVAVASKKECNNEVEGANRGETEGPGDLLGVYFQREMDCRTCLDGVDNNCNGLTDCAEPACAECFIGVGVGCGGGSESPCAQGGCSTAGERARTAGNLVLMGMLMAAAVVCRRRWTR